MKIEWLGHAAFIIVTDDGTKILLDPYESGGFGGGVCYAPIKEDVDIVTVSHSHSDHCHIPAGLGKDTVIIRDKIDADIMGITIRSIDSFHDSRQGKQRGTNSIFLFDINGIKIAHFGDLGHSLDDVKIKELGRVDVALLPVGGNFTISAGEASDIVEKVKPKIVIPMHYKTDKVKFEIDPVDEFLKNKKNVEKTVVSTIEITPQALSSITATKIIVLQSSH